MPLQIPFVPSIPSYRFSTTIDGTQYIFDVRWNARAEAWYFDLLDEAEDPIRHGIKVVLGAMLGGTSADERFPRGAFFACDMAGEGRDAGFDDLGSRIQVYFFLESELEEGAVA